MVHVPGAAFRDAAGQRHGHRTCGDGQVDERDDEQGRRARETAPGAFRSDGSGLPAETDRPAGSEQTHHAHELLIGKSGRAYLGSMYLVRTPELIKPFFKDLIWNVPGAIDQVYLTFDDGPIPEVTPWVLDQLAAAG